MASDPWACNFLPGLLLSDLCVIANSKTLHGGWHITPTLQMNTRQPRKPGEGIWPSGTEWELRGWQPRPDSHARQCFPRCFSAPANTQAAASIPTVLELLGYAWSQLDDGAKENRTLLMQSNYPFRVFDNVPSLAEICTSTTKKRKRNY